MSLPPASNQTTDQIGDSLLNAAISSGMLSFGSSANRAEELLNFINTTLGINRPRSSCNNYNSAQAHPCSGPASWDINGTGPIPALSILEDTNVSENVLDYIAKKADGIAKLRERVDDMFPLTLLLVCSYPQMVAEVDVVAFRDILLSCDDVTTKDNTQDQCSTLCAPPSLGSVDSDDSSSSIPRSPTSDTGSVDSDDMDSVSATGAISNGPPPRKQSGMYTKYSRGIYMLFRVHCVVRSITDLVRVETPNKYLYCIVGYIAELFLISAEEMSAIMHESGMGYQECIKRNFITKNSGEHNTSYIDMTVVAWFVQALQVVHSGQVAHASECTPQIHEPTGRPNEKQSYLQALCASLQPTSINSRDTGNKYAKVYGRPVITPQQFMSRYAMIMYKLNKKPLGYPKADIYGHTLTWKLRQVSMEHFRLFMQFPEFMSALIRDPKLISIAPCEMMYMHEVFNSIVKNTHGKQHIRLLMTGNVSYVHPQEFYEHIASRQPGALLMVGNGGLASNNHVLTRLRMLITYFVRHKTGDENQQAAREVCDKLCSKFKDRPSLLVHEEDTQMVKLITSTVEPAQRKMLTFMLKQYIKFYGHALLMAAIQIQLLTTDDVQDLEHLDSLIRSAEFRDMDPGQCYGEQKYTDGHSTLLVHRYQKVTKMPFSDAPQRTLHWRIMIPKMYDILCTRPPAMKDQGKTLWYALLFAPSDDIRKRLYHTYHDDWYPVRYISYIIESAMSAELSVLPDDFTYQCGAAICFIAETMHNNEGLFKPGYINPDLVPFLLREYNNQSLMQCPSLSDSLMMRVVMQSTEPPRRVEFGGGITEFYKKTTCALIARGYVKYAPCAGSPYLDFDASVSNIWQQMCDRVLYSRFKTSLRIHNGYSRNVSQDMLQYRDQIVGQGVVRDCIITAGQGALQECCILINGKAMIRSDIPLTLARVFGRFLGRCVFLETCHPGFQLHTAIYYAIFLRMLRSLLFTNQELLQFLAPAEFPEWYQEVIGTSPSTPEGSDPTRYFIEWFKEHYADRYMHLLEVATGFSDVAPSFAQCMAPIELFRVLGGKKLGLDDIVPLISKKADESVSKPDDYLQAFIAAIRKLTPDKLIELCRFWTGGIVTPNDKLVLKVAKGYATTVFSAKSCFNELCIGHVEYSTQAELMDRMEGAVETTLLHYRESIRTNSVFTRA